MRAVIPFVSIAAAAYLIFLFYYYRRSFRGYRVIGLLSSLFFAFWSLTALVLLFTESQSARPVLKLIIAACFILLPLLFLHALLRVMRKKKLRRRLLPFCYLIGILQLLLYSLPAVMDGDGELKERSGGMLIRADRGKNRQEILWSSMEKTPAEIHAAGDKGRSLIMTMEEYVPGGPDSRGRGTAALRSSDGGETWTEDTAVFHSTLCPAVSVNPQSPDTVLVSVFNPVVEEDLSIKGLDSAATGIYRSRDAGNSWQRVLQPQYAPNEFFFDVAHAAAKPKIVYAVSEFSLYRSSDGGNSWKAAKAVLSDTRLSPLFPLFGARLEVPGQGKELLITIPKRGVFRSSDGGNSFSPLLSGTSLGTAYDLSLSAGNGVSAGEGAGMLYAASPAGIFRCRSDRNTWSAVHIGPEAVDTPDQGWLSIACDPEQAGNFLSGNLYRPLLLWSAARSAFPAFACDQEQQECGIASVAFSPHTEGFIAAGLSPPHAASLHDALQNAGGVYLSPDYGKSRQPIVDDVLAGKAVYDIVFHPAEEDVIFAASAGGLYVSRSRGRSWRKLGGLPREAGVRSLAFFHKDPRFMAAAVDHYGLYLSSDGGLTWHDARPSGAAEIRIHDVLFDADDPRFLYVSAFNDGFYLYRRDRRQWRRCSRGLDGAQTLSMTFGPENRILYLGSAGRGVFSLDTEALKSSPDRGASGGSGETAASDGIEWQAAGVLPGADIIGTEVLPGPEKKVMICDFNRGLLRIVQDGVEEMSLDKGPDGRITSLRMTAEGRLYAGSEMGAEVFFSDDFGETWRGLTLRMPGYIDETRIIDITEARENPLEVFVLARIYVRHDDILLPFFGTQQIIRLPQWIRLLRYIYGGFMLFLTAFFVFLMIKRMRGKHKPISFVILSTAYLSLLLSFLLFEILSEPLFPLPSAVFPPLLFLPLAAAAVVVLEKRRRNKQIRPESSYRSFARQFKNPVFIVDRNYQVVTANRAAEKLLEINKGVVRKSGNSAPLPSLLDAAGMDAKMMPSIPAADSAGMSFELPFGRPDGSARLRMSVSPVSLSGAAETAAFSVQMAADDFALLCSSRKYGLTGRETEIVSLLMKGLSNKGIAEELYISLATVKTHLHNIYEKTGTGSRNRLVECVRSCEPELD